MKRLGLDIGTNSIGWCLIEDDARIVAIGVRIFSDGRDPKSGASLAVDRRAARAMRRRRDRYLGRRTAFLKALKRFGLMPADESAAKLLADRDPYELRARALEERLEPYEIGRALFHLNQRRGFKSNRKAERKIKDAEDGKIASGAKALDQAIAEDSAETLGQFLAGRDTKRVRMGSDAQGYDFYPQRRHVECEFDTIWSRQQPHHPVLLTDEARDALKRILFFQRPLKEQEVGVCSFVHSERRLAKAHPLFQERRLYEEVNQLEITTPGEANRKLTMDERDALILELRSRKERSFDALGKRLKLEPGQSFNKASESRTGRKGDEVYAVMADKKRFGDRWPHLDRDRQWAIIERIIDEEDPDKLHAFLTDECGLSDEQATVAALAPLPELYGRLGPTATARILEELKKDVITYDEAVRRAGWHHSDDRTGEILPQLPYYGELLTRDIPPGTQDPNDPPEQRWGKITNPTVHIGLRQLEKLVNAIIKVHGRPDQIVVELARELKLNEKDKEEHNRRIRRDTAAAQLRSAKLQSEGIPDTGANRMLLRMWEDLNPGEVLDRRCPYCGGQIGIRQLFSEADVDHIIPYSRSLDDSVGNKVVAHRNCNRIKGTKTPYERWGHNEERWETIASQVARLHKSKQWRFGPDAMERVEKDGGFIARQLTDTQYLSRLAGRYLSSLYGLTGDVAADGKTPIVVHRVPLMSLKPADISDPDRIPDPELRAALHRAIDGLSGKAYEAALAAFAKMHPQFAGIRRVRVRESLNVIPIHDGDGRAYKAYKGDANARYDVWQLPSGKWTHDIVSMFEAHQRQHRLTDEEVQPKRPHPAAKKVLSLRQNDMLAIERNGGAPEIVRVVKFSTIGAIALAPHQEGGALKARDAAPQDVDPFKYIYSSGGGLKNLKARQVRIDPLGRIFDPGPR